MAAADNPNLEGTEPKPAFPLHKEGFTIDDYHMIVRIGEGSFGEVWKAERGGFPVALKILNASINTDEAQRELKSLETLKRIHHKFLVHTENFWSDGDRLYIEMELADGGTLKERLKAYQAMGKEGIPEDELLKYFTEAAQALDYLHGHRPVFLHRDIKPANILLVQGCAKLADFGLLRQVTGDNTSTKTQGGTPVYMAPESVKEDKFSVATDLWSFAVTYAELRQGKLPFSAKTQFQIFQKVCQDPPELSDIFHAEERKVLLRALEKEPGQRFCSCGDFVFELNRVVPWTPAVTVPVLPTTPRPERKPGSSKPKTTLDPGVPTTGEQGGFRKRPGPTMADVALPSTEPLAPNAPTVPKDDGTVINEKSGRSAKPAPPTAVPSPASITKTHPSLATEKKSADPFTTAQRGGQNRTALRLIISAVVVAALSGIGFLVFQGWNGAGDPAQDKGVNRDKAGPALSGLAPEEVAAEVDKALRADKIELAQKTVEQNQKALPDGGEKLLAKIDHKTKASALLKSADVLLKKKDFDGALSLLTKAKTPFEYRTDADRKADITESARDGVHGRLVGETKDAIKTKDAARVREKIDELTRFRDDNPRADWKPDFQELPLPSDLLTKAWNVLVADRVVPADARRRLEDLKEYANPQQPEKFVLDPAYEKNVAALEALVKAHEVDQVGWDAASKELIEAMRVNHQPPVARNLWIGLAAIEGCKKRFRFKDLDALPPAPDDPATRQARAHLFTMVLERLVREDNYQWFPSDAEMKKCRTWLADFKGPGDAVLALKAESLVRCGAKPDEISQLVFPAKKDWYVAYAHALVADKTQSAANAADALVAVVKGNPNLRKERMKDAGGVLRSAVGALMPKGRTARAFASKEDAAKALTWLTVLFELENAPALEDLLDLTVAALKAETKEADDIVPTLAARFDKLAAADKLTGYRTAGKAFRADVDSAAGPDLGDRAILKSERAQNFASQMRKADLVQEAGELNGKAVELKARAAFGKMKDGIAKYRVFEEALKKAETAAGKKPADGFALPVVIAALESAKDFSKVDLEAAIGAGETALDLKMPPQDWLDALRARAAVRTADAKYVLLFKKVEAGEKFTPADEYPKILKLYQQAKPPQGKYVEKFDGELLFKIGRLHALLVEYKNAYDELKAAREKLAAIRQPYPEEVRAEIVEALALTENLLKSSDLEGFDK